MYKGGLTASYDVDIWGANRSAASAAGASLEAQKAAADAANLSVAASVAVGYVTLLSLDEQLRVTQQTLQAREDAWRLAKRQYETGYTSRLELMQADSSQLHAGADPAAAAPDCAAGKRPQRAAGG